MDPMKVRLVAQRAASRVDGDDDSWAAALCNTWNQSGNRCVQVGR